MHKNMANLTCKFYARRSSDTYIYLIIKIGIVKINDFHAYISQCFAHELPCTTRYCPLRKRTVLPAAALVAILAMTLVVTGGGAIQHAGEPWQAAALNPETYQPAGTAWSILDTATSALLPGYAFAQVQDSTPPTFDSSELHSDTGVLTITFSETIDVTPATNVVPAKIHIRESDSYTGGITLSVGELDTAAAATDGTTISFTLTESHLATVAGLTTPELTIEPGAVRDTSGNPIDGTFDISTAVFVDATLIRSWTSTPTGMTFSNDGLRMFVTDGSGYDIDEYALSDAFDASTRIFVNSTSVSTNYVTPTDMAFSNDGLKMFTVNVKASQERTIKEYTLSTAFDVSTLQFVRDQSVRIQERTPTGMAFSSDGLKMFVVGFEKDSVNEYALSAPFDLYGLVFVHAISVADQESTPRDVAFSNDGLKMFVVGSNQDKVHEYTLSTAFDVSTAIHVDSFSVAGRESTPSGMAFSNDGAKMFVVGSGSDNVNEYTLNSVYPITVTTTSATTPTLASIERYDPVAANTGSQTLVYKATFSENVTGVDASDFALSSDSTGGTGGGSSPVTNISGLGDVYHLTVFALQNGTYNLDLVSSGHGIADAAANPLTNTTPTTGADQTYTVSIIPPDNTVPTLVSIHRSSPAVENTSSQTLVYKVAFSEDVTGVDASDFALSPDSIGGAGSANIGGNSEQFKQTRSPALAIPDKITVSDTITVSNSGTAASVYVAVDITHAYIGDLKIDLIAPDGATRTLHNREGGSAGDIDRMYTLSFDDLLVAGTWKLQIHDGFNVYQGVLNNWTLTINYGDPPTIPVTGISGSGDVYYVTVSALQNGTYNLDLVSSGHNIADAASNSLANTSPAGADETYTVSTTVADNTNPRLESIERYSPVTQNTDSQTLVYEVTFSEDVTGVGTDDFVLSSGSTTTADPVTSISGSDSVYYATVFASTDGTYNLDLVSQGHGIKDAAENPLTDTAPTTGTDHTYTVSTTVADSTAPTLTSIERSNPATQNTTSQTLIYKATFSESVTGVGTDDFVLSSGSTTTADPVTSISGSDDVYYVTVSASTDGTYNLDLVSQGHGIKDAAENPLTDTAPTTGTDHTYTVSTTVADSTAPTLTSIERSNPATQNTTSQTLVYKATFSEDVTGIDTDDFVLSSDSTGGVGGINTGNSSEQFTQTQSPALAILGVVTVSDIITVPDSGTATSVSVSVDIAHTWIADLLVELIAPDGTTITLHDRGGGSADDIDQTYAPDFEGVLIAGNWTLRIDDNFVDDPGVLNSWTLTVNYGNATTTTATAISGSGDVYYVTVSAMQDGTYNLDLVSQGHGIKDAAENPLTDTAPTTGTDHTYTVSTTVADSTAPTLTSIERSNPATQNTTSQTLIYKATFSESVTGVGTDDFVLSSGSTTTADPVTSISGSDDVYYVTVSASTDGTYNLDLVSQGHGIKDAAENPLTDTAPTTGTDHTYTVSTTVADSTAPTLTSIERSNPATQNTTSQTLVYKATFSEDVTGIDTDDFVLSSDSTGGVGGINTGNSSEQFTQTQSPALAILGVVTVSDIITVPDSGTATSVSVSVDIAHTWIADLLVELIAPDGTTITLHDRGGGSADDIDQTYAPDFEGVLIAGNWTLRIDDNFVDDPGVLNSWTLTVNYGNATTTVTDISGSGDVYYVTVSAMQDGTYNLDLVSQGHGIKDAAENPLTDTAPTTGTDHTYTVSTTVADSTAPTLTSIERSNPATQNTTSQTLIYKATFSESVTGVGTDDFVLSSGSTTTADPVTSISGSDDVYYVTVSASTDGTYNLDLVSQGHGIKDAAENPLTDTAPTTGTDHTYTVSTTVADSTAPTLTSIERSNPATQNTTSQTLIYKATFSESVTGVGTDDFVLSSGSTTTADPVTSISGSDDVYYVTVSASTDGTYNLDLVSQGHGIKDAAENPLTDTAPTTGTDHTYTVSTTVADSTAPTLTSIERSNPATQNTTSQTLVYKATFSEDVTGIDTDDFVLSSDSTGGVGGINTGNSSEQFTQTQSPALAILGVVTVSDIITVPDSGTATSVSVSVDIAHTWIADLLVELIAPDGTTITLHDRGGGSADDIDQTYAPDFEGVLIAGNWTLRIDDNFVDDPGVLNSWTLTVNYGNATTTTATAISGSGDVYYVTVSAMQDGTYNLDLVSQGHGIKDAAENPLTDTAPTTGTDHTYTVSTTVADSTAPTLTSIERSNPTTQNTTSQTLIYKATFSESVTGVGTDDFVLSSGSTTTADPVTSISGSDDVYYVTVSASTDGTYNLDLVSQGHGIKDAAENPLTDTAPTTGTDHTYTVSTTVADSTAPTLTSIERSNPATQNTTSQTLVYKATFSEDVTGIDTDDFVLSSDSTGGVGGINTGNSSEQFTQTQSPALAILGVVTVSDIITVPDSGTATSVSVSVDIAHTWIADLLVELIAPDGTTITLHDRGGGSADDIDQTYAPDFEGVLIAGNWTLRIDDNFVDDPGVLNSWTLTVNYGNATTTTATAISGSGDVYYVTVSAMQDGTYNLDLVSQGHGIKDAAENPLTDTAPTTGTDHTYTVSTTVADSTAPTLTSIERSNPATQNTTSQTLIYKATFSESVTGVDTDDFVLSSDSVGGGNNNNNNAVSSELFTQTRSPLSPITNNNDISDTIKVPNSGTVTSVSVTVNISHTYIGDLKVELVAPDGTIKTLHNREGDGTNNIIKTYTPNFDDDDAQIQGDWKLRINDNADGDTGTLNSWTLKVSYDTVADTTVSSVTDISGSGDVYYVTVSAMQDGTYNLDLVSSGHGIADTASNQLTDTVPTGPDHTYTVSTAI